MYFKGKNVLVTGGAGVIGRELIKELCNLKANVICIDKALRPDDISSEVQYIQKNILDLNTNEIVQSDPEIIFHLAATFERIEETPEFWDENFNDNILVGHKVVDAAIKCKSLKKFIFPSSYLVYSFNDYLNEKAFVSAQKLHETDYVNPRNLIGSSKYYTEKELDYVNIVFGNFITVSARIFRVYGCGSKDIISRWIRAAINEEELVLYQKENIFDYIYAGDVAKGLIKMAETIEKNDVINLGTGNSRKVEEVINLIKMQFKDAKINEIKKDLPYEGSCADISKLEATTNWHPNISLEEGIEKVINYEIHMQ